MNMETLDTPEPAAKPKRTLLITLSVLTFVCSAGRIVAGIALFYFFSRRSNTNFEISSRERWIIVFAYSLLFSSVLYTVGAVLMLMARRIGFWIYLSGFFACLFAVAAMVFASRPREYELLYFKLTVLGSLLFPVVFLILYAVAVRREATKLTE